MNVKLQKQLAYNYKGKQHFKHVIVIPEEALNELGWKGGQELDLTTKNGQLIATIKNEKLGKTE
jgi:hypothetical protein